MNIRLEYQDGSSNKFWEGRVDGSALVTRWGKVGTGGQSKSFAFSTHAEAKTALDDKVREKTKKGYVAVSSSPSETLPKKSTEGDDGPEDERGDTIPLTVRAFRTFIKENAAERVHLLLTQEDTDQDLFELASQEEALSSVEELIAKGATLTDEGAQAFFRSKGLRNVRKLTWDACSVSFGVIEAFEGDCGFESLQSLTVIDTDLGGEAWESWIFASWWKNLRVLHVSDKGLSDTHVEVLTWNDGLASLEDVTLRSAVLTDRIADTLATAKLSSALKTFSVESPLMGAKGWRTLLQQEGLPEDARKLFLERSQQRTKAKNTFDQLDGLLAGDVGGEAWRDALLSYLSAIHRKSPATYRNPHLEAQPIAWPDPFEFEVLNSGRLETVHQLLPFLWLSVRAMDPEHGDMEWGALAGSPAFRKVRSVSAHEHRMSVEQATRFARSKHVGDLQELEIGSAELGDEGAIALLSSATLTSLSSVRLSLNDLTVRFVGWLCESPLFARLERLELSYNDLGDDAVALLLESPAPRLRRLHLGNNALTDLSLRGLTASPLFGSLEELVLERNEFSREGLTALMDAAMNAPKLKRLVVDESFVAGSSRAQQLEETGVSLGR
jgi:predicted DNA-binding WGR domain protein